MHCPSFPFRCSGLHFAASPTAATHALRHNACAWPSACMLVICSPPSPAHCTTATCARATAGPRWRSCCTSGCPRTTRPRSRAACAGAGAGVQGPPALNHRRNLDGLNGVPSFNRCSLFVFGPSLPHQPTSSSATSQPKNSCPHGSTKSALIALMQVHPSGPAGHQPVPPVPGPPAHAAAPGAQPAAAVCGRGGGAFSLTMILMLIGLGLRQGAHLLTFMLCS